MTLLRRRSVVLLVWSVLVWTALWGDWSAANALAGLAIGSVLLWLAPPRHERAPSRVHLPSLAWLVVRFVGDLVASSAEVAWEVVTPGSRINAGVIAAPLRTRSPLLVTLIGNMITLTPGTLTLEVLRDDDGALTLYVHVLHLKGIDDARENVRRLEARVLAAFGRAHRIHMDPSDITYSEERGP